jgi:hypothetical protein
MAMIGTARCGPNASINAGISIVEAPKPTMPESVPATRPRARMAAHIMTGGTMAGDEHAFLRRSAPRARQEALRYRAWPCDRRDDGRCDWRGAKDGMFMRARTRTPIDQNRGRMGSL